MQGRGRQAGAANSQYANPVTILGNQWCACKRSRQSSNRHDLHKQLTVFGIRQQRSTPAKTKALWIFPRTGSADVYSSTRTASKSSRKRVTWQGLRNAQLPQVHSPNTSFAEA